MASEAMIERRIAAHAEARGAIALKLRLLGSRGWPDRLLLAPDARVLFVEVKAPGGRLRPSQVRIHDLLRRFGFEVITIDSVAEGRAAIDHWLDGT